MKRIVSMLTGAALALMAGPASALYLADVAYELTDNGGGNFTATFEVFNTSTNGDTAALDFFEISLDADPDLSAYTNIAWEFDNGWLTNAFEYDPGLGGVPAVANADDAAVFGGGGGIAQGASLGGFEVRFDYAGSLTPSDQLFGWYAVFGTSLDDPWGLGYSWAGEDFGQARYVPPSGGGGGTNPVPEPGTLILLGSGLVALAGARRKRA